MALDIHRELSTAARLGVRHARPTVRDASAEGAVTPNQLVLLRASYLVARDQEQAFFDLVEHEVEEHGAGFDLTASVTGPWPPYNFVGDLGPDAQDAA